MSTKLHLVTYYTTSLLCKCMFFVSLMSLQSYGWFYNIVAILDVILNFTILPMIQTVHPSFFLLNQLRLYYHNQESKWRDIWLHTGSLLASRLHGILLVNYIQTGLDCSHLCESSHKDQWLILLICTSVPLIISCCLKSTWKLSWLFCMQNLEFSSSCQITKFPCSSPDDGFHFKKLFLP